MKIPEPILKFLKSNRIVTPTPIQLQGIPTACVRITTGIQQTNWTSVSQAVTSLASHSLVPEKH